MLPQNTYVPYWVVRATQFDSTEAQKIQRAQPVNATAGLSTPDLSGNQQPFTDRTHKLRVTDIPVVSIVFRPGELEQSGRQQRFSQKAQ